MPKFGYFGPKGINFLILIKFGMYPILNVLISSLTLIFKNFEPKFYGLNYGQILWPQLLFL